METARGIESVDITLQHDSPNLDDHESLRVRNAGSSDGCKESLDGHGEVVAIDLGARVRLGPDLGWPGDVERCGGRATRGARRFEGGSDDSAVPCAMAVVSMTTRSAIEPARHATGIAGSRRRVSSIVSPTEHPGSVAFPEVDRDFPRRRGVDPDPCR